MINKNIGFTLAEVLITLGVIGIIAALTIPSVVGTYRKKVVETRLKKVYSMMNQSILLAENDYGDRKGWDAFPPMSNTDINVTYKWFNKYIRPYIKFTRIEENPEYGEFRVWFNDGSKLVISAHIWDMGFFIYGGIKDDAVKDGVDYFNMHYLYCRDQGFSGFPCQYTDMDLLMNEPVNGCANKGYNCSRILQLNNWNIPKDYPKKF